MAVAPDGDMRLGAMLPDAFNRSPQPPANLLARRRLAGAQDRRRRTACGGVVNVDGQKATLIVAGVPLRQLPVPVRNVEGAADVRNHGNGRLRGSSGTGYRPARR